ncbi:hypothetical protein BC939DRAFT_438146 [Gamsiella multidivaricata]|uniref:uncharacterized protein n=1 Tax=Gamsiella multidivaricata TaxID=101098 RepID=UPI00221E787B|nr:uncharacterized protein BC939DRAFT_438146 [Gamsiella multidivaricata]KAI7831289.1 hypothetical protein BC939DRAFT_438146 [Gamsiella multidivaricata]
MEYINTVCEREGYPIVVEYNPTLGNHAKAARDIPQGEGLLRALPYAAEVFDNYKKRMCHVCLLYHNRSSFTHRCQECDQVYYCSEACKAIAMDPQMGAHGRVCRTLRKLATWNSNRHTKSMIKLLLQVLLNHWRERHGIPTAYQSRKTIQEEKALDEERNGSGEGGLDGADKEEEGQLAEQLHETLNLTDPDTAAIAPPTAQEQGSSETRCGGADHGRDRIQEPVENDFYDVLRLQSHFEDWDEEDTKDWNRQSQTVLSFLEMSGLTEIATEPGGALKKLTRTDIKKLISTLESNAFGMFDRMKKKPVCFGRAIYPIASFFNHSCECNATAVQADGSLGEVTGDDVVGFMESKEAEIHKDSSAAAVSSVSEPPAPLPTPSETSAVASNGEELEQAKNSEKEEDEDDIATATAADSVDPYDCRIGGFRMMTFFAIKDIAKGQDITISYIDTEMPLHARRLALLSDYHFHCCCERCLREEKSGGSSSSSKKAAKENKGAKKGGRVKGKADKKAKKSK